MSVATEPGRARSRGSTSRQRRRVAAGEDVFGDPGIGGARPVRLRPMACISATPSGCRQRVTVSKNAPVMADADMLEHADRDDAVEALRHARDSPAARSVTRSDRPAAAARAAASASCSVERVMPVHAGAEIARQGQRHAAPAAADVEHVQVRPVEHSLAAMWRFLASLRLLQRLVAAAGNRRRNIAGRGRGRGCRAGR